MSAQKVYLASPLGFSPEYTDYLSRIKQTLQRGGFVVLDPWDQQEHATEIRRAEELEGCSEKSKTFKAIAAGIGVANERLIRDADMILAVLDGLEVDSGTASEVGFGSALGKKCYGLRTDWRNSGDFPGIPCNLQVLHFIERTGGTLFRAIEQIALGSSPIENPDGSSR